MPDEQQQLLLPDVEPMPKEQLLQPDVDRF